MKPMSTILIVDDEPGARDTLEALLLPEGYKLEFASNGREALEKAEALTPSLILLDVMMPEMDGFEVCRHLRSRPLIAEVPIILITALDDRESRLRGIEAGADDFLSKPFDFNELRARVRSIVRLDRYRRLLEERVKFEWVVQHANDGYLIVNEPGHIVYANSVARLYLGFPADFAEAPPTRPGEPIEETFLELADQQYRMEPKDAWRVWPATPEPHTPRYLVRPETVTAEAFWLQVDTLSLPSDSENGRVVRLRDVTAQVIARRNRRGFHTMICHKLRTPMVGLLGSLGFMVQHAATLDSTEVKEFSEMALKSVERLHGEIEDILQYLNTPGTGKADEAFNAAALHELALQISDNLGVDPVTVSTSGDLSKTWLPISQQAMELILWEILENSKKFHPDHAPTIQMTVTRNDDRMLTLKIKDDGMALSPDQLSQLWMPYYQGEKYSTGEVKGMGLGLSTVASLIWEGNGSCRAYNRKQGEGIVIELSLPIVSAEEPP